MNGNKAIRPGRWINDSFDVATHLVATATGIDISLQM